NSGVAKSTNGGGSWSGSTLACGLLNYVWALAIDPVTPTTIYAGGLCGVRKSINGGESWSAVNTGLLQPAPAYYFIVRVLAADLLMPTSHYAGTAAGVLNRI